MYFLPVFIDPSAAALFALGVVLAPLWLLVSRGLFILQSSQNGSMTNLNVCRFEPTHLHSAIQ